MTNLEGMHSYFWLVSPRRMKTSVRDDIPYTDQALRQDLLRVQNAWEDAKTPGRTLKPTGIETQSTPI